MREFLVALWQFIKDYDVLIAVVGCTLWLAFACWAQARNDYEAGLWNVVRRPDDSMLFEREKGDTDGRL